MNYDQGLMALKSFARHTDWQPAYAVQEAQLLAILVRERLFGPDEQSRRDRARIVDQLNALALKHVGVSFNELCLGVRRPLGHGPGPVAAPGPAHRALAVARTGSQEAAC